MLSSIKGLHDMAIAMLLIIVSVLPSCSSSIGALYPTLMGSACSLHCLCTVYSLPAVLLLAFLCEFLSTRMRMAVFGVTWAAQESFCNLEQFLFSLIFFPIVIFILNLFTALLLSDTVSMSG